MKQLFDHYNADGEPCDRWGNVIYADGMTIPDGGSLRVNLMMCDSAQRAVLDAKKVTIEMTPAKVQAAVTKHLPGYQLTRIDMKQETKQSDGYKQGLADAAADNGQTQYETRIANAWRDGGSRPAGHDDYTRGINDACREKMLADQRSDSQIEYETRVTEAWR